MKSKQKQQPPPDPFRKVEPVDPKWKLFFTAASALWSQYVRKH